MAFLAALEPEPALLYTSLQLWGSAQVSSSGSVHRFPPYEVEVARGELRKFGNRIRLERKPWLLLLALLDKPGMLVTRSELQAALWPDGTFVDFEHGLNVAVKKLRAALCDSPDAPRFIETVAGEGYRFIGPVERLGTACNRQPLLWFQLPETAWLASRRRSLLRRPLRRHGRPVAKDGLQWR